MGACACGGPTKEIQKHFIDDEELAWRSDAYNPRTSTLYNILRKTKEMIVLQTQGEANEPFFANSLQLDTPDLKPQKLKTLIGSRRVILIGQFQAYRSTLLKSIQAASNSSRTYVLASDQVINFLAEFPIFSAKNWQNQKTVTSQLPIMVINTIDIKHSQSKIRIYVHATNKKDMRIYRQLGINKEQGFIPQPSNEDIKEYYLTELIRRIGQIEQRQGRESGEEHTPNQNIVLLHNPKLDPAILADIFTSLLSNHFGIPPHSAKIYLARSLPTSIVAPQEPLEAIRPEEDSDRIKLTPIEVFQKLFRKYESEAGKQKVQRAYNLLNTLTTNIYSHTDEQMYRRVKRTTRQVNQLLNSYKSGKNLLQELGWKIQGEMWVNNIQGKYLKIFKTDFDLGYKLYAQGS